MGRLAFFDLDARKKEWEMREARVIYDGPCWNGHLRIYKKEAYTAQYFFRSPAGWQVSVDLDKVEDKDLVKYLIGGRAVAGEMMRKKIMEMRGVG